MKYIIFEDFAGKHIPVIFPDRIGHEEMREQMPYATTLSGGYVTLKEGRFLCHGSAPDLDIHAAEDDAALIAAQFADADA